MSGEHKIGEGERQPLGEVARPSPDLRPKDKSVPLPDLTVDEANELEESLASMSKEKLDKKAAELFSGLSKMLKKDGKWDKNTARYKLWEKVSERVKAEYEDEEKRIRERVRVAGEEFDRRQAAKRAEDFASRDFVGGGVQASGPIRQSRPKNATPAYPTESAPASENLEEYEGDVVQLSPEATRELLISEKKELETQLAKTLNNIFIEELQLRAWKKKTESAYNRFFGKKFEEQIDSVKFALNQLNAKVVEIGVKLTPIISQLSGQKAVNISGDISKQVGLYNDSLARKYKTVIDLVDSGKFSEKELEKLAKNAPTQDELNLIDAALRLEEETPPEVPVEEESVQPLASHVEHTAIIPRVGEQTQELPVVSDETEPVDERLEQPADLAATSPEKVETTKVEPEALPNKQVIDKGSVRINWDKIPKAAEIPAFDFDSYLNKMLGAGGIAKVKEHAQDVKENLIPLEGSLQADKNELSQTSKFWHPIKHSNLVDRIKDTQEQIDMYKEVLVEQAGMVKEAVDQFVKNNRSTDSEIKQANDEFNQHLLEIKGKTGDSKSYMELSIAMLALFTVFSVAMQADSRLHEPKPLKDSAKPQNVKAVDQSEAKPGFISDTLYNAEHFFTTSSDQKIETPAPQTMPDEAKPAVSEVVSKPVMSKEPIMTPTVKVFGGGPVLREVGTGREITEEPIVPKSIKPKHERISSHAKKRNLEHLRTIDELIEGKVDEIKQVQDEMNRLDKPVVDIFKITAEEADKIASEKRELAFAQKTKQRLEQELENLINQKDKVQSKTEVASVKMQKHKKGKDKGRLKTITVERPKVEKIGSLPTDPEYTIQKMQEQNKARVFARETTPEARQANLNFERLLNGSEGVVNLLNAYVGAKGSESGNVFLDQAKEQLAQAEKDMRGVNIHPDLVKQLRELQAIVVGYSSHPEATRPAAWLKDRPVVERHAPATEAQDDGKIDFTKILPANLTGEIDRINNRSQGGADNVQIAAAALNRLIATKIDADRVDEFLDRAENNAKQALTETGLTDTDKENAVDILKTVQSIRQDLKGKELPKSKQEVQPVDLAPSPTSTSADTNDVSGTNLPRSSQRRDIGEPKPRKALFEDDITNNAGIRRLK